MIFILCEILFLVFALRAIFFWVNLWQIKEYRLDRFFVHLKDTRQGKYIIFSYEIALLLCCFLLYFVNIFSDSISGWYSYIVIFTFSLFSFKTFQEVIQRKLKRPILTVKAMGVIVMTFLFTNLLVLLPLTDSFFWLVCIAIGIPYIVAFVVFLFAFPTEVYTDIVIQRAKKKRMKLKKLIVIAISGSYGKSSTKEVIAHLLSKKYFVTKTNLSNNTPIAIANTLLQKVTDKTDLFVVELGAYKKGEIAALTDIVKPTISVTTAVSDQHLALYGSMNDVISSELELLDRLPKQGKIFLNGDSKGVHELSKKIKGKQTIFWYQTQKAAKQSENFYATDITATMNGVSWKFHNGKTTLLLHSPLLGIHTVANILPAVALALQFGLSEAEIKKSLLSLQPLPKTMQKISPKIPQTTFVDDSFNASPESVDAAIEYLALSTKRKILVLSPLIELGKAGAQRHFEIGQKLKDIDICMLTNKNFYKDIEKGIYSKNGKTQLITGSYSSLATTIKSLLNKGDTIVFEGKEAGIVLKNL